MKKLLDSINHLLFTIYDYFMYSFDISHLWGNKTIYIWKSNGEVLKFKKKGQIK